MPLGLFARSFAGSPLLVVVAALVPCAIARSVLSYQEADDSGGQLAEEAAGDETVYGSGWCEIVFGELTGDARRMGYGLDSDIPNRAAPWLVDGIDLLLYDLDGDGTITLEGRDGFGLAVSPYIVSLPEVVLVGTSQYKLSVSQEQIFFEAQALDMEPELVRDAASLNEMRIRGGRRPAWIDARVSRDCSSHIEYLVLNNLSDRWHNPSTTIERPGWAGRTTGGDIAAGQSIYAFGCLDLKEAIDQWSRTAFHGALLMDPRLSAIGVAHESGITMLRHFHNGEFATVATLPPDGAREVSPHFHPKGERPNPVPGSMDAIGSGTPIVAYLPETLFRARIDAFNLRRLDEDDLPFGPEVPVMVSSPMRAANPYWAQNYGCLVMIPQLPLEPEASYRVSLRVHGFPKPIRWSFSTAEGDSSMTDVFTADVLEGSKVVRKELQRLQLDERLRASEELAKYAPREGWQLKLGKQEFYFFDMDGSGDLSTDGLDGIGMKGAAFVVPLSDRLLTQVGQLRLTFDEAHMEYRTENLPLSKKLVKAASLVTELRIAAGLRPIVLDQLASHHAQQHVRYLIENEMNDGSAGLRVHHEDPELPGYTPAGARAAQLGVIACGSSGLDFAVWNWFTGAYHRPMLIDPKLESIGVAYEDRAAVLVPAQSLEHPQLPWTSPAAGATGVPIRFCRDGEVPNPVLGTKMGKGLGFPILVRLPRSDFMTTVKLFRLLDEAGVEVKCEASSPADPANLLRPQNAGCAFLIPRKPLKADALYRVEFQQSGRPLVDWEFTTKGR
ncbi:MAG: hypothetical protein ACI841_000613 [Planctomycetota bacterium]|jgi:uncharacterized protein YkwD